MNSVFNFLGTTVIPKQVENKSYAKLKGGGGVGQRRCIMGDVQVSNGKREHNKMQREKEICM